MSVVSSTGNIVEDKFAYHNSLKLFNSQEELLFCNKTAYAWRQYINGPCYFKLDDPGNVTQLNTYMGTYFCSGGTWTNDGRWLGAEYNNGLLWDINPENGEMIEIGGGGTGLNGLAYNPVNEKLYGASSYDLFEVNITTGEQTYIGAFGIDNETAMIAIAFDADGICFGWDVKYSGDSYLFKINTSTGEATKVGSLGMNLLYPQDGHFDMAEDILYLAASRVNPYICGLYKCDEDTGDCTFVGRFENNFPLSALAIPYNWPNHPPDAPIIDGPSRGKPGRWVCFTFQSTDPDGDDVMYFIYWGDRTSDVTDFYPQCEPVEVCHKYIEGSYIIRAKAKDINGAESEWTEFRIEIPRNKAVSSLFTRLIEQYPILEVLLRRMNLLR